MSQSRWWPKKQLDHSSKWTSLQTRYYIKLECLCEVIHYVSAHTHGDVLYVSVEQGSIGIGEQDPGKTSKNFTKSSEVSFHFAMLSSRTSHNYLIYLEKNRRRDQSIVGYIIESMMKMPQKCKCNLWCINLLQNPYEVPMWRIIMRQNCFKHGWFGWMWMWMPTWHKLHSFFHHRFQVKLKWRAKINQYKCPLSERSSSSSTKILLSNLRLLG